MCRAGGRRCPSHSDPVAIANRNARRRAAYQKSKGKVSVPAVALPDHALFRSTVNGKEGHDVFTRTGDKVQVREELNIAATKNAGELAANGYFIDREVTGTVDYTKLDENSYLDFGFKPVEAVMEATDRRPRIPKLVSDEIAGLEVKDLTVQEQMSLTFFTTNEYEWVNDALYKRGYLHEPNEDDREFFTEDKANEGDNLNLYVDHHERTPRFMREVTSLMDSALEKGPHQQRIVYRGMSNYSALFADIEGEQENKPSKWIEQNLKLGQEMILDGYQSTSTSPMRAAGYAGFAGGIVFEILTPEGVNITTISEYQEEQEVLLPRGARYMVVGIHKVNNYCTAQKPNIIQLVAIDDTGALLTSTNHHKAPELEPEQLTVNQKFYDDQKG